MLTQEMTRKLVDGLLGILGNNVWQIVLYGSVARKENTDESDVDIAVILNGSFDMKMREEFISWAADLDLKYGRVFSIIDIEKDKLEKWGSVLPFYKNIYKEGIVLWKAA